MLNFAGCNQGDPLLPVPVAPLDRSVDACDAKEISCKMPPNNAIADALVTFMVLVALYMYGDAPRAIK